MGNSAATSFIMPMPKKMSWGRQKDDTVKLEDFLTECEEEIWRVKGEQNLSVKKVYLIHDNPYIDDTVEEEDHCYSDTGERLNPAFIGDEGL